MSPLLQFVVAMLAQLPNDISAVFGAVESVKGIFSTKDLATLTALRAALDTKTDADVSQFDKDAAAAVAASVAPAPTLVPNP